MSFAELGLAQPLLRAVVSEGYTTPTPIQTQAIPHVVAGRDLMGCAQTGTGKTAAFALPILHRLMQAPLPPPKSRRRIRVLVLSPTRELAAQIGESFGVYGRHAGMRHTVVYGGVGQHPQVRALQHGVDILVATPGRLLDLMNQRHIDLSTVEIFVLDEADRMLDMGFLPDLKRIIAKLPAVRQTLCFSATMPAEIERLTNSILRDPVRVRVAPVKATAALIEHSVYLVPQPHKPQLLTSFLTSRPIARALVFTRTKHGADRVVRQLSKVGIRAEAIHGDKSQSARQRSLASFKSARPPILVATDLAARGLDVDGVSHVLNYDLPREAETYVHRIGRTGRAGATGIAVSFCGGEERRMLKAIERLIRQELIVARDIPLDSLPPPRTQPAEVETQNHSQPRRQQRPAHAKAANSGKSRPRHGSFAGRGRR